MEATIEMQKQIPVVGPIIQVKHVFVKRIVSFEWKSQYKGESKHLFFKQTVLDCIKA